MALTRKFLSALGIEADKVDEIIEAHAETVNALKAERDDAKASATETEELRKQLAEAKKELEANSGKDAYKEKYEEIKREFDEFKASQDAKAVLAQKEKAYKALLKDAGISEKRLDAILKVTDLSTIELEGDAIKDAENLAKTAKAEWADFVVSDSKQGAGTDNPPTNENGQKIVSIPSIF